MDKIWVEMIEIAKSKLNDWQISEFINAGQVSACLQSDSGRYYKGICIDTSCNMGMCAERNAIAHMLTHGENRLKRVVCIDTEGKLMPPCGVCREFIMQLAPDYNANCEFLLSLNPLKTITLDKLLPQWWGKQ